MCSRNFKGEKELTDEWNHKLCSHTFNHNVEIKDRGKSNMGLGRYFSRKALVGDHIEVGIASVTSSDRRHFTCGRSRILQQYNLKTLPQRWCAWQGCELMPFECPWASSTISIQLLWGESARSPVYFMLVNGAQDIGIELTRARPLLLITPQTRIQTVAKALET